MLKAARINFPKCSFVRVTHVSLLQTLLENKNSKQYVMLNTEMSCTPVFCILGIYFLEPITRNQL